MSCKNKSVATGSTIVRVDSAKLPVLDIDWRDKSTSTGSAIVRSRLC